MATAYYASSQILLMWAVRYGMPKLDEMLRQWGAGRRTPDVLRTALGKAPDELDREFRNFAEQRLARYTTQFVPLTRSGPLPAAKAAAEQSTARAPEHTMYALALLRRGRAELAKQELKRALAEMGETDA